MSVAQTERIQSAHQQALAERPAEPERFLEIVNLRGGIFTTTNPEHLCSLLYLQGWESGEIDQRRGGWREYKTNRGGAGLEYARLKRAGAVISISESGTIVAVGGLALLTLNRIARQQEGGR